MTGNGSGGLKGALSALKSTPPPPIIVGTVAVLAIVVMCLGPLRVGLGGDSGNSGPQYVSLSQLAADYDEASGNFRSYNSGDTILVRDTVQSSVFSGGKTLLMFNSAFGPLGVYVSGDVSGQYSAGCEVVMALKVIQEGDEEALDLNLSQDEIWPA